NVALAQGWPADGFANLYEKAVTAYPKYLPIHFTAANYYSSSYYGSDEAFRAFVDGAVARTRAQLGTTLYARLNWLMANDEMFENGSADWGRMKAGFEEI